MARGGVVAVFLSAALAALSVEVRAQESPIEVQDAWARPLPKVVTSSELYMVIHNRGAQPDRLVAARSTACGMAELYEWYMSPQGAMGMRPVAREGIEVPPRGRVELKPAGLHIMCMGRKGVFERGVSVPVTLRFERTGEIPVRVTVREP